MSLFGEILNEASVYIYGPPTAEKINDAIDKRMTAIIRYNTKEEGQHLAKRTIFPVAYGTTKSDNIVVRAYQTEGDTTTVKPGWKFFRVDRILSWANMKNSRFSMQKLVDLGYNKEGDDSMAQVFNHVRTETRTTAEKEQEKAEKAKEKEMQVQKPEQTDNEKQNISNPSYSTKPVTRQDVDNHDNVSGKLNPPKSYTTQSELDKNNTDDYINSDEVSARMIAPENAPVSKNQINAISPDLNPSPEINADNMKADNSPITKSDLENNPLTSKFKEMNKRWNAIDSEDEDEEGMEEK